MIDVEIWSDVMCPWCYIGKKRLERALTRFSDRDRVRVTWRSFELRPDQSPIPAGTLSDSMAGRFRLDTPELTALFERIRILGAAEGLELHPATARPVRSFDAHRLIHLAARHGLADPVLERLFRAHLSDNANVADHDLLLDIATDTGLPSLAVRTALNGDAYAADVRSDQERAARMGVRQVPAYAINGTPVASGTPETAELLSLLHQSAS